MDTFIRGHEFISNALLIKERFLPLALEQKRWNLAVAISQQALEFFVKGLLCLQGMYKDGHDIHAHINRLCEAITTSPASVPIIMLLEADNGDGYFISIRRDIRAIQLTKKINGTRVMIGSTTAPSLATKDVFGLRLEHEGHVIRIIDAQGRVLLATSDADAASTAWVKKVNFAMPAEIDADRRRELRGIAEQLYKTRRRALYVEEAFTERDALEKVNGMRAVIETMTSLLIYEPTR